MGPEFSFKSLLILSALAFLIPLVLYRIRLFKIPVVIVEIITGIIVGKSGLNIVKNDIWVEFLALLGFAFLMFLSGLEIDLHFFKNIRRPSKGFNPLASGIGIFLLTFVLAYFFARFLGQMGITKSPLFLTLIFSTTSLGIVVPILKARQISNLLIGQAILIAALIADFLTILLIPVVMFLVTGDQSIDLIYAALIVIVFGVIFYGWKRCFAFSLNDSFFETSQLKTRAAFALILLFVTLAEVAGIEIILGAFLAGVLYSLLFKKIGIEITPALEAIGYGFLIPIFFIMVGVKFELQSALTLKVLLTLPLFIYIAYLVKMVPVLIIKKYFSWKETIAAGFLLSSRLSLVIALAVIANKEGIITPAIYSTLILLAIVTCLLSPLLFLQVYQQS